VANTTYDVTQVQFDDTEDIDRTEVRSYWQLARRRFVHHRLAVIGAITLALLIVAAATVPLLVENATGVSISKSFAPAEIVDQDGNLVLALLGYSRTGINMFTQLMAATATSLMIGFAAVLIIVFIGVVIGAVAGYAGGWVDNLLMRVVDIALSMPGLFIIIAFVAFWGASIWTIIVAIGITGWTTAARLVRAEFLSLREADYVQAARALGASPRRIILRHMLPPSLAPIIVAQAQELLVGRLAAEKGTHEVIGVAGAVRLQDLAPVGRADEGRRDAFARESAEHVVADDLRPQIAVVAGVIAADEVAEAGEHEGALRIRHSRDVVRAAQGLVEVRRDRLGVQRQVELPVEGLDGRLDALVHESRRAHELDELVGHRLIGRVVAREAAQDRWLPRPVLHDLGRCLNEVPLGVAAGEAGEFRAGEAHVQDVAELVEQRLDLGVLQQRRPIRRWRRHVRDDRGHRRHV
jgi:peptide/nickel transport system permease protein